MGLCGSCLEKVKHIEGQKTVESWIMPSVVEQTGASIDCCGLSLLQFGTT